MSKPPSFTFHQTVTSINEFAFAGCCLASLALPKELECIGTGDFRDCINVRGGLEFPRLIINNDHVHFIIAHLIFN